MQEDKFLDLLYRYFLGYCSLRERNYVERWLAEDQSHRKYFDTIKKVWEITPNYNIDVDFEKEWHQMRMRLDLDLKEPTNIDSSKKVITKSNSKISRNRPIKYFLKIAAVILLMVLPAYYFSGLSTTSIKREVSSKFSMQKIETAKGERANVEFSDGSKIMLNSMSSVRFPRVFNVDKREIYLDGEAFFRVVHNEEVPFIVHVNGVDVEDIGTEFNINGYKEDDYVEVVVRKGKVVVRQKNELNDKQSVDSIGDTTHEVFLSKGQRTLVKVDELPSKAENVSLKPYLAWVNGRMFFEGTPLRDVIKRLERAYDLKFQVRDSSLLSEKLKASFKRENPEKVLGIITFSLGIDYEFQDSTVILKSK